MRLRTYVFSTVFAGLAFLLFSGVLTAQDQQPDRVYMRGQQQPKLGLVQEEGLNKLIWKPRADAGGGYLDERTVSWRKIRGIQFGDQPTAYLKARNFYNGNRSSMSASSAEEAIDLLNEIIEKKEVNRAFFIPRAQYLKADILYKKANTEEEYRKALEAYETAIDRYPQNRGYFGAIRKKYRIHRKLGETEKALSAADQLEKKNPRSRGKSLGPYLKAQVYKEQEQFGQAADQYRKTLSNAKLTGLRIRAKLSLANSLMKLEQYENALKHYKNLLNNKQNLPKSQRDRYLVGIHNGIGRATFHMNYQEEAGEKEVRRKNVQLLKNVLLHFLKGVVWYSAPQSGRTIEFERSYYWVARSFAALAKNVDDGEKREKYTQEAHRALNTLFNKYPSTSFSKKARDLQQNL